MNAPVSTVLGCDDCVVDCSCELQQSTSSHCTDQCRVVPCEDLPCNSCNQHCLSSPSCSFPGHHDCIRPAELWDCCATEPNSCMDHKYGQLYAGTQTFNDLPLASTVSSCCSHLPANSLAQDGQHSTLCHPKQHYDLRNHNLDAPHLVHPSGFPHRCLWNSCSKSFPSATELVDHVNAEHLWFMCPEHGQHQGITEVTPQCQIAAAQNPTCLWDHCDLFSNISTELQEDSQTSTLKPLVDLLTSHLIRDHHLLLPNFPDSTPRQILEHDIESSSSEATPPQCSSQHKCCWNGCGEIFESSGALTQHVECLHVGTKKSHYQCCWDGCARQKSKLFSSKQKVLRHIQSHTGHRPFQCTTCGEHFSEAATLQQHVRRHTKERPYVCSHPQCSKRFATMGALTIHTRIHNGEKPFKCSFCDRAFSESSNLSKHLRTHSGAKSFVCEHEGCGKCFARADQLLRHSIIHQREN